LILGAPHNVRIYNASEEKEGIILLPVISPS
jgi:hypothetical protein